MDAFNLASFFDLPDPSKDISLSDALMTKSGACDGPDVDTNYKTLKSKINFTVTTNFLIRTQFMQSAIIILIIESHYALANHHFQNFA